MSYTILVGDDSKLLNIMNSSFKSSFVKKRPVAHCRGADMAVREPFWATDATVIQMIGSPLTPQCHKWPQGQQVLTFAGGNYHTFTRRMDWSLRADISDEQETKAGFAYSIESCPSPIPANEVEAEVSNSGSRTQSIGAMWWHDIGAPWRWLNLAAQHWRSEEFCWKNLTPIAKTSLVRISCLWKSDWCFQCRVRIGSHM